MGLSLSKMAGFFGLADEDEVLDHQPEVRKPAQQAVYKEQPQPARQKRQKTVESTERIVITPKHEERKQEKVVEMKRQAPAAVYQSSAQPQVQTQTRVQPQTHVEPAPAVRERKIAITEPRVYSEAMPIAKRILAGEAVLVNFHLIEEGQARRIVDFLTGTVYAVDGDIKRVGNEIFLCTPSNMEIDGATAQSMAEAQFFDLDI